MTATSDGSFGSDSAHTAGASGIETAEEVLFFSLVAFALRGGPLIFCWFAAEEFIKNYKRKNY